MRPYIPLVWLAAPVAAALFLVPTQRAAATTIDVGGSGIHDCTFPCVDRYQQVYAASIFSGPVQIDSVSFFVANTSTNSWVGTGTWQMSISTSAMPVSGLDTTFSNNVGGDVVVFDTLSFTGTPSPNSLVTFDGVGAFAYDPTNGDLLIDIVRTAGPSNTSGEPGFDAWQNPGLTNRAFAWTGTTTADEASSDGYGLRTRFGLIPEPSTGALVAFGLAGLARRKRRS